MISLTILETIQQRHSRRHYREEPLDPAFLADFNTLIHSVNETSGLHIQLMTDHPEAFAGFLNSYGLFSGVRHFLAMVGNPADPHWAEKIGWYGEQLVLEAVSRRLGTCWVGGTYDKSFKACELRPGEQLLCVIALGPVNAIPSTRERLIAQMTHRRDKTIAEMCSVSGQIPKWFREGMNAVHKAPSAMNHQPVHFSCRNDQVTAVVQMTRLMNEVDLGIAKYHFQLGAGGGYWPWGNGQTFTPASQAAGPAGQT